MRAPKIFLPQGISEDVDPAGLPNTFIPQEFPRPFSRRNSQASVIPNAPPAGSAAALALAHLRHATCLDTATSKPSNYIPIRTSDRRQPVQAYRSSRYPQLFPRQVQMYPSNQTQMQPDKTSTYPNQTQMYPHQPPDRQDSINRPVNELRCVGCLPLGKKHTNQSRLTAESMQRNATQLQKYAHKTTPDFSSPSNNELIPPPSLPKM